MGKKHKDSGSSSRRLTVEERRKETAAQERRERVVRYSAGVAILVFALGIVGVAAYASQSDSGSGANTTAAQEDPNAALPRGVISAGEEFEYGLRVGSPSSPDAPTLQVWEDFQCPACKTVEELNGKGLKGLGTSGRASVVLRPTTFLDGNLGNNNSVSATAAWGCAIDQDKGLDYHAALFATQPAEGGAGWSRDTLIQLGEQVGITGEGLGTFTSCVDSSTYRQWALNSTAAFFRANIAGTPTGVVNGTETISGQILGDPVELEKALFGATSAE